MKMIFCFSFLLATVLTGCVSSEGRSANNSSKRNAVKWYNSHAWLNGLKLTPHGSIDKEEFSKEYHAHPEWWDKAFAFIKNTDLAALKTGDHQIVGTDVFARVSEGPLKHLDSTKWEAHKNYADIHHVIRGKEKIGIGPVSSATVIVPYDSKRDIAFYDGKGSYYIGDTGNFFIAFTKQIHRPGLEVDGKGVIKKLVIKVRTGNN